MQLAQAAQPDLALNPVVQLVLTLLGIGMLVCWIMEIIAAFKKEEKPLMGIISIVGGLLCTPLVPLIIGWINAKKWDIKKIMMIWTVLFVVYVIVIATQIGSIMAAINEASGTGMAP